MRVLLPWSHLLEDEKVRADCRVDPVLVGLSDDGSGHEEKKNGGLVAGRGEGIC